MHVLHAVNGGYPVHRFYFVCKARTSAEYEQSWAPNKVESDRVRLCLAPTTLCRYPLSIFYTVWFLIFTKKVVENLDA